MIQNYEDVTNVSAPEWAFRAGAALVLLAGGFALGLGADKAGGYAPVLAATLGMLLAVTLLALLGAVRHQGMLRREIMRVMDTDGVTDMLTRTAFEARVMRYVGSGGTGALLVVAFEDYAQTNDWLGVDRADGVLRHAMSFVRGLAGETGFAGRMAGAEFCVFLPHAGFQSANDTARQIVRGLEDQDWPEWLGDVRVKASVGGVAFSHPTAFQDIYEAASLELSRFRNRPHGETGAMPVTLG